MDNEEGLIVWAYHPAEVKAHEKYVNFFLVLVVSIGGVLANLLALFISMWRGGFIYEYFSNTIRAALQLSGARLNDLQGIDLASAASYISAILLFFPICAVFLLIILRHYIRHVLRPGLFVKFHVGYIFGLIWFTFIFAIALYVIYFFDFEISGRRWPGLGRILDFPFFGFFSSLTSCAFAVVVMNYISFFYKLIVWGRGRGRN